MIAVDLAGRIGNQLFIYAFAEALRQKRGKNEKIIFYDKAILDKGWYVALKDYNIPNVEFQHDGIKKGLITRMQDHIMGLFYRFFWNRGWKGRYEQEVKFQWLLNLFGVVLCCNGYLQHKRLWCGPLRVSGFFQSEKYFKEYESIIRERLSINTDNLLEKDYVQKICSRNAVCISIKVEHNAGNPLFDVCSEEYYTKAIKMIQEKVENPFFFICSDNVQYVVDHYIDVDKYDYVCQESGLSVIDSLAIMGMCQHFIIGNTSFGWWAQFFCQHKDKNVIAPKPWFRNGEGDFLYCDGWTLIDCSEYINKTEVNYHK